MLDHTCRICKVILLRKRFQREINDDLCQFLLHGDFHSTVHSNLKKRHTKGPCKKVLVGMY